MSLSWYVVQVSTNMEDSVQTALIRAINGKIFQLAPTEALFWRDSFAIDHALNAEQIELFLRAESILVPKEKIEEIRNGKRREQERKIFPGYLLMRMHYSDELGLLVRRTPKISNFVGVAKDSRPVPISQQEVDDILQQITDAKSRTKHRVEFAVGEQIRIIDGPFIDFHAIIEEVIYDKFRLRVNVQIFGRDTSVDLEVSQVAKII